jgi:hypothetical protein
MSLDGFIAGSDHMMDWVFDFVAPDEFPEIAVATALDAAVACGPARLERIAAGAR